MPLDLSLTSVHVVISLLALAAGLVLLASLIAGRHEPVTAALFLATTLATSLTGFLFPSPPVTPAQVFGVISVVTLAVAIYAVYRVRPSGRWRTVYVVASVFALYLNAFVGVVQAFQKIGPLHRLAPTQTEPAFIAAQSLLLVVFAIAGYLCVRQVRPTPSLTSTKQPA